MHFWPSPFHLEVRDVSAANAAAHAADANRQHFTLGTKSSIFW
jgi:hypothetical protein